jgi:hypothetical protein
MKQILVIAYILLTPIVLLSQDAQDELSMIKTLFGNDKDFIVMEFVKVEGANKVKFEKLYADFESSRKDLGQKKYSALNNYVKSYNSLSEADLDEIMREIIDLNATHDKLIASYYKKIKKYCGISVAAQFYQIEWYMLSQIRTSILENIPTINELDKK